MHATLVYNPQAGSTSRVSADDILKALSDAGYDPTYSPTDGEDDLDDVLERAKDLIVVAGGDGSIRAVVTRLLDRNIHVAPLPLGTANNIAHTLALTGKPLEIIAGLAEPLERVLDIGCVKTPQGTKYFLEAMGIGLFADILEKYNPEDGKSVRRSIQTLISTLQDYQPKFFHVNVDGQDLSGSYVLFEVMNTPTLGYRIRLASDAQPDDGYFNLVLIHANPREKYTKILRSVLMGNIQTLPDVSVQRGKTLEIAWRGFPLHVDGEVIGQSTWVDENGAKQDDPEFLDVAKPYLQVKIISKAVHFLVPAYTVNGNKPTQE